MNGITAMLVSRSRQRRSFFPRSAFLAGLAVAAILFGPRSELFADAVERPFRIAFTFSLFGEVNENDVRAAMKVWLMTGAQERSISVDPDPNIHRTVGDLIRFARSTPVDGFGITTPEYLDLSREMSFDLIAVASKNGRITEEYLLLVREDSPVKRLDQLAGRTLAVLDNPRLSLAVTWLDTVLMEAKLRRSSAFFKRVAMEKNVSQAVLPVFFGKTDACLVTRDSFEVMSELNPQLKQQLRVLTVSPPLIPACFVFLKDAESVNRTKIIEIMNKLEDTPAGRQILEIIKTEKLEAHDISCLDESLELLSRHQRLARSQ